MRLVATTNNFIYFALLCEILHAPLVLPCDRKRKKVMKEKRKLRDKMSLNMVIPGDQIEQTTDVATFDLEKIKHKHVRSSFIKRTVSSDCLNNSFAPFACTRYVLDE